jgi:hypothetical protein
MSRLCTLTASIQIESSLPSEVAVISSFVDKVIVLLTQCGCIAGHEQDVESSASFSVERFLRSSAKIRPGFACHGATESALPKYSRDCGKISWRRIQRPCHSATIPKCWS